MKFGSVCSGIEAASVAWEPFGWEAVFFAEIESFPSAVLKARYPNVPNLGDMTKIDGEKWRGLIDVLVGGTPCQAFSVAGLRKSLQDERGNLTLMFVRLLDATGARIAVWENVPGVLSTADNAFGCFLGALVGADSPLVPPIECGGRWTDAGVVDGPKRRAAWRTLDAQYFGLAQRRKRVFVVASTPEGPDPAEILFEREGLQRNSPPSREAGKGTPSSFASSITASGRGVERGGSSRGQDPVVAEVCGPIVSGHTPNGHGCAGVNSQAAASGQLIPEVCGALNDGAHFGGGQNGQDAYSGRIIPVLNGKEPVSRSRSRDVHRGENR